MVHHLNRVNGEGELYREAAMLSSNSMPGHPLALSVHPREDTLDNRHQAGYYTLAGFQHFLMC
jgi:hypothetical protein